MFGIIASVILNKNLIRTRILTITEGNCRTEYEHFQICSSKFGALRVRLRKAKTLNDNPASHRIILSHQRVQIFA